MTNKHAKICQSKLQWNRSNIKYKSDNSNPGILFFALAMETYI
jgi:hypothetical protein